MQAHDGTSLANLTGAKDESRGTILEYSEYSKDEWLARLRSSQLPRAISAGPSASPPVPSAPSRHWVPQWIAARAFRSLALVATAGERAGELTAVSAHRRDGTAGNLHWGHSCARNLARASCTATTRASASAIDGHAHYYCSTIDLPASAFSQGSSSRVLSCAARNSVGKSHGRCPSYHGRRVAAPPSKY